MEVSACLLSGFVLYATLAHAGKVKKFYVSTTGDDDVSGSWRHPFATFKRT